jgi:hypothetical protein
MMHDYGRNDLFSYGRVSMAKHTRRMAGPVGGGCLLVFGDDMNE